MPSGIEPSPRTVDFFALRRVAGPDLGPELDPDQFLERLDAERADALDASLARVRTGVSNWSGGLRPQDDLSALALELQA